MMNRRKAMIGWLVYTAGKPLAKRALKSRAKSAKSAVPGTSGAKGAGASTGAILAAAGAALGALLFWRSRKSGDDDAAGDAAKDAGGSEDGAS